MTSLLSSVYRFAKPFVRPYFGLNRSTLSGAIDIIVIKHPDGSLHSTPFYVRFGKLELLVPAEHLVSVKSNGKLIKNIKLKVARGGRVYFSRTGIDTDLSMFSLSSGSSNDDENIDETSVEEYAFSPGEQALIEDSHHKLDSPFPDNEPTGENDENDDEITTTTISTSSTTVIQIKNEDPSPKFPIFKTQYSLPSVDSNSSLPIEENIFTLSVQPTDSVPSSILYDSLDLKDPYFDNSPYKTQINKTEKIVFAEKTRNTRKVSSQLSKRILQEQRILSSQSNDNTNNNTNGTQKSTTQIPVAVQMDESTPKSNGFEPSTPPDTTSPQTAPLESSLNDVNTFPIQSPSSSLHSDQFNQTSIGSSLSYTTKTSETTIHTTTTENTKQNTLNFDEINLSDRLADLEHDKKLYQRLRQLPLLNSQVHPLLIPTSSDLEKLQLKIGKNDLEFSVSSKLQGTRSVDCRIYLWNWDTQIVVSDVDGTITKSDVLGHIFTFFGKDWSHPGVSQLYSSVSSRNYQMVYLSSRSIGQSTSTRKYLTSLTQDGHFLPDGPLLLSPSGMLSSLKRELYDKTPHKLKIHVLFTLKSLFPESIKSPLYAGFGNKSTDLLAYSSLNVAKTHIFIINPQGQIFLKDEENDRWVQSSYEILNDNIDTYFPPILK